MSPAEQTMLLSNPLPPARHVELPVDEIVVVEGRNDRQAFEAEPMLLLQESMRWAQLQEIVVNQTRGRYELVAGERRLRAAQAVGKRLIECRVYADLDDLQIVQIMREENLRRADLNIVERARSLTHLVRQGLTTAQIAANERCSEDTIRRLLTILELPAEVQEMMTRKSHALPIHQACRLAKLPEGQILAMAHRVAPVGGPVASDEQCRAWIDELLGKPLPFAGGPVVDDDADDNNPPTLATAASDDEWDDAGEPRPEPEEARQDEEADDAESGTPLGDENLAKLNGTARTVEGRKKPAPSTRTVTPAQGGTLTAGVSTQEGLRPVKIVVAIAGKLTGRPGGVAVVKDAVVTLKVGDAVKVLSDAMDLPNCPGLVEAVRMALAAQRSGGATSGDAKTSKAKKAPAKKPKAKKGRK